MGSASSPRVFRDGNGKQLPFSDSSSSSASSSSYTSSSYSKTKRDVSYSCGSCAYDLKLSSSDRNTSAIGSKYGKSIKRGTLSFFYIDESRFTQVDKFRCISHLLSRYSFGLYRRKIKLLCRKCGNQVGDAYDTSSYSPGLDGLASTPTSPGSETSTHRKYDIWIYALQPLASEEFGVPFIT